MKSASFTQFVAIASTAAGALLLSAGHASAFTFETTYKGTPPTGDIMLQSVKIGEQIIKNFALVNNVVLVENDLHTGGNTGAASSDHGDDVQDGLKVEAPSGEDVKASLGNLNLNKIIDTEDSGSFVMDLYFDQAIDKLLLWERGINSTLKVQIGNHTETLTKDHFGLGKTNFSIDTTEIGGKQKVGSFGLNLFSDFGIEGGYKGPVRIISEADFNGPDFKVIGVAAVPEPATVLGLTAVAGAFVASRRRKSTAA
jgi:hypothetical protein